MPDEFSHEVKNNDIVILATDGILDNLYLKDIKTFLS